MHLVSESSIDSDHKMEDAVLRDKHNASDGTIVNSRERIDKEALFVIFRGIGLIVCLHFRCLERKARLDEVVGVISVLSELFSPGLKDRYLFAFGSSKESKKDGKIVA
jgi:hypothetical protein